MPTGYPVLTPMYGLGSSQRTVGAVAISSPRSRYGSAGRIYAYLNATKGPFYALNYIQKSIFGPFVIRDGRLVWN